MKPQHIVVIARALDTCTQTEISAILARLNDDTIRKLSKDTATEQHYRKQSDVTELEPEHKLRTDRPYHHGVKT